MPEHTSFLSYLLAMFPALGENMKNFGTTFVGQEPVDAHGAEPLAASALVVVLLIVLSLVARGQVKDYDKSVIPDEKLSLRTFFEIFVGYFYTMMKDMMGPTRAKKYFPVIGTAACFILFSNFLGMIPGFLPPTASWNVTAGTALVAIGAFIIYGLQANGFGFTSHRIHGHGHRHGQYRLAHVGGAVYRRRQPGAEDGPAGEVRAEQRRQEGHHDAPQGRPVPQ